MSDFIMSLDDEKEMNINAFIKYLSNVYNKLLMFIADTTYNEVKYSVIKVFTRIMLESEAKVSSDIINFDFGACEEEY